MTNQTHMKNAICLLFLSLGVTVAAQAQFRQAGPADWGNFKRYEQANASLTAAPLVVLMG